MSKKILPKFLDFMEIEQIVLTPQQVEYFKYFISRYHEHFDKGQLKEAHHCSVAVLLEIEKLILGSM